MAHIDRTQCKTCGDWYWTGDSHTCSRTALYLPPGLTPTDLPGDRAGITHRFHVVDHTTLIRRAVLDHAAAPAPIGAES